MGGCGLLAGEWVVTGCVVFPIILSIAVNVKRCASANKPCMVGGWVQGGGWVSGLLGAGKRVGEWVAGCVVFYHFS